MKYIIAFYVAFMVLYWIEGEYTDVWTLSYYGIEKLFSASGFILLALNVHNKKIRQLSLYAASVCIFMFLYFIYCMAFGHSITVAVTSFLFYSLIALYLIKK